MAAILACVVGANKVLHLETSVTSIADLGLDRHPRSNLVDRRDLSALSRIPKNQAGNREILPATIDPRSWSVGVAIDPKSKSNSDSPVLLFTN